MFLLKDQNELGHSELQVAGQDTVDIPVFFQYFSSCYTQCDSHKGRDIFHRPLPQRKVEQWLTKKLRESTISMLSR